MYKIILAIICILSTGCCAKTIKIELHGKVYNPLPNQINLKIEVERKV